MFDGVCAVLRHGRLSLADPNIEFAWEHVFHVGSESATIGTCVRLPLIREEKCFILHAPRQMGKTSALLALADLLDSGSVGSYCCLCINAESAQIAREYVSNAVTAVIDELGTSEHDNLGGDSIEAICTAVLALNRPRTAFKRTLSRWARADPRPPVLLIDEIDSLIGGIHGGGMSRPTSSRTGTQSPASSRNVTRWERIGAELRNLSALVANAGGLGKTATVGPAAPALPASGTVARRILHVRAN